jgi:hypothetical protein
MWNSSAGAAVVKSVQTGTITMSPATQAVPITSVTIAKTFVVCQSDTGGNNNDSTLRVTCELTNSTTLTITVSAVLAAQTVRWYVVEFWSGVSVQSGLTSLGASLTVAVPIAAVTLAKTFVLISERINDASSNRDERWTTTAQLTSTTNLQLTRTDAGAATSIAWQVIQIESAFVQAGTVTIATNQTAATVTLSAANAVDTTRTFLVFTRSAGTAVNGREYFYQTTGEITNATTFTFARAFQNGNANTQVDIAWFAVRMTDGTTVQRGLVGPSGTGAGSATMNAALASAIVINRSVPIISARGDAGDNATTNLNDTSWKAGFTTTTNLQMTRVASNSSNATVAWQVVQFSDAPNLVDGDGREFFPP